MICMPYLCVDLSTTLYTCFAGPLKKVQSASQCQLLLKWSCQATRSRQHTSFCAAGNSCVSPEGQQAGHSNSPFILPRLTEWQKSCYHITDFHTSRAIQYMSQALRYQVVYLACVSNPRLPKCKPSMWHRHLMVPVTVFQTGTGQCWANSWNLQKTWLSSEASFPSCEAPPPIISTMQNEGRWGKDYIEALGKGTRHQLLQGRMSVGKEKGKQQKSNAARMEKQQGQKQYWPAVCSLSRVDQRGFFFPLCTKFWLLTESRKIFKRELYFQHEETEITWKK